ncbi:MAG: TetR/AcrR family transcriptional regulator [Firmicutes bacterium]|nr:TetR/AcrR family transcriptional regulator [Bacillota bacterium]
METRDRIITAFYNLAAEQGFTRATVDELARRNGMSKRTIYRHFNSKENLVEAVLLQFMREAEEKINQCLDSSDNPIEKMTSFIRLISEKLSTLNPQMLQDMQRHYPHLWEKVEQFRADKVKKIIIDKILLQGIEEGYFKKINPEIVAASMLATIRAVINPTFVLENNLTIEQAFNSVFDTFLHGIVSNEKCKM